MPKTCLVLSQSQQSPWRWPIAIGLLSGMVMGCSGPDTLTGVDLGCLAWVGLVPLLAWIYCQITCEQPGFGARFGRIVLVSGAFGLGYHLVFGRWLLDVHPMTWLGFSLLQSRLLSMGALAVYVGVAALYWMVWAGLISVLGKVLSLLYTTRVARWGWGIVVASLWLGVWGAYDTNLLGMPWASLTVSLAPHEWFRAWLGLLGTPTLTWLMVATQAWCASRLGSISQTHLKSVQRDVALAARTWMRRILFGLSPLVLAGVLWFTAPRVKPLLGPEIGPPLPVGVSQGHLPIATVRDPAMARQYAPSAYWQPALQLATSLPADSLILLPEEGPIPDWVNTGRPHANEAVTALQTIATQQSQNILSGCPLQDDLAQPPQAFNALVSLNAAGQAPATYRKRQLVPFGEMLPWLPTPWANALLSWLGIDFGFAFTGGPQAQTPIMIRGQRQQPIKVGGLICFEGIYRQFYQQYQQQGVQLIVNASNLGWFHDNPQLARQFLAIQQQYAAEFRLPLVLATNSGLSAIVSSNGTILKQSPSQAPHVIRYDGP